MVCADGCYISSDRMRCSLGVYLRSPTTTGMVPAGCNFIECMSARSNLNFSDGENAQGQKVVIDSSTARCPFVVQTHGWNTFVLIT